MGDDVWRGQTDGSVLKNDKTLQTLRHQYRSATSRRWTHNLPLTVSIAFAVLVYSPNTVRTQYGENSEFPSHISSSRNSPRGTEVPGLRSFFLDAVPQNRLPPGGGCVKQQLAWRSANVRQRESTARLLDHFDVFNIIAFVTSCACDVAGLRCMPRHVTKSMRRRRGCVPEDVTRSAWSVR